MTPEIAAFVASVSEATDAYVRGDMDRYLSLTTYAPEFTLTNPFGGPPTRFADRPERVRASKGFFKDGSATVEVTEVHHWDDTIVLVMIERQHTSAGGLPDQDWSLRVTQIHRRVAGTWLLIHRHADPLVHPLTLDQAATLARGELA